MNEHSRVSRPQGYKVYAVDRNVGEGLAKLDGADVSELDVTSAESISKFKDHLGDRPVDLLLNIAGKPPSVGSYFYSDTF